MSNPTEGTEKIEDLDYQDPKVCQKLKSIHDECFYTWYHQEFLTGQSNDPNPCATQWEIYQSCVQKRLEILNLDRQQLHIHKK